MREAARLGRMHRPVALVLASFAFVLAACSAAAGSPPSSASSTPGSSEGSGSPAALKEALLARFGDLAYCDPDQFPVARADETAAARDHLAEMRADSATWAAIAKVAGFDVATTPTGDVLIAAYRNWKMLQALQLTPSKGSAYAFDATFHGAGGSFTHATGTIAADGTIDVASQEPGRAPACPICLARGTLIATPNGEVPVEALRSGDAVWSTDATGTRIAAVVVEVGSTPVPPTHLLVRLALADGRVVEASPGHPLPDGRLVGSLRPGDVVDGSTVVSADRVPDRDGRTFDLLPSGPTAAYWADGILLQSTLSR
ncbi:MAG TPA: Hint domain-containing protein [Candidatus Limnocylindrales bacterium]